MNRIYHYPKAEKPRFNQESLIHLARRQLKSILSSGFKNFYLDLLADYLEIQINQLTEKSFDEMERLDLEKKFEVTEAAIRQYAIYFPVNETLFIPENLTKEQIKILKEILTFSKKAKRHLYLAHPS